MTGDSTGTRRRRPRPCIRARPVGSWRRCDRALAPGFCSPSSCCSRCRSPRAPTSSRSRSRRTPPATPPSPPATPPTPPATPPSPPATPPTPPATPPSPPATPPPSTPPHAACHPAGAARDDHRPVVRGRTRASADRPGAAAARSHTARRGGRRRRRAVRWRKHADLEDRPARADRGGRGVPDRPPGARPPAAAVTGLHLGRERPARYLSWGIAQLPRQGW